MNPLEVVIAARALAQQNPRAEHPGAAQILPFLREVRVVADPATPTASIARAGSGWCVRLGPDFVAEQVREPVDALALLAHEALHALRGHFGLPACREPWRAQLMNLALDVLVNAVVARLVVAPPIPLFERLYPLDTFPACLLRPPTDLCRAGPCETDANLAGRTLQDLGRVWGQPSAERAALVEAFRRHLAGLDVRNPERMARLWLDGWLTVQEPSAWWSRFQAAFAAEGGHWRQVVETLLLLGDPSHPGDPDVCPGLDGFLPGAGGELRSGRSPVAPQDPAWRAFLDRVRRVVEHDPKAKARGPVPEPGPTVLPRAGRREIAALAAGRPPALYNTTHPVERRTELGVHLYLDVSGSTHVVAPTFFGIAATLGDSLALPAWAWSTEVRPLSAADIRSGRFQSTGGTDLDCVVEHARARGFGRILVLTDGDICLSDAGERDIRARGPRMVLLLAQRSNCARIAWASPAMRFWRRSLERVADELIEVPRVRERGGEVEDMPF